MLPHPLQQGSPSLPAQKRAQGLGLSLNGAGGPVGSMGQGLGEAR